MLQQTQVDRVIPKYKSFLKVFPNFKTLARAPLKKVLKEWQRLGYNRRALYLQRAAQTVIQKHHGVFPRSISELEQLPGIGPYTARAIATFAFNESHIFIETNIRSVFIHHFFPRAKKVSDAKLIPLIEKTLPKKNVARWYAALMDYGAHLKKTLPNPSRKSAHHVVQKKFKGSQRELRGMILKILGKKKLAKKEIVSVTKRNTRDVRVALTALQKEGLIKNTKGLFRI